MVAPSPGEGHANEGSHGSSHGGGNHVHVTEKDEEDPGAVPVLPGMIRLAGHFCGVATTASHCLEIALPIADEVTIDALFPVISDILDGAKRLSAKSEEGAQKVHLWSQMLSILQKDTNKDATRQCLELPAKPEVTRRENGAMDKKLHDVILQERALEVDYEAKERLVEDLMQDRDKLRQRTMELEQALAGGGAVGCFSSIFTSVSSAFGSSKNEKQHETGHGHGHERSESHASLGDNGGVQPVEHGKVLLHGHFAGRMVTKGHCVELAMPVDGTIPGAPVMEMAAALRQAATEGETSVDEKVWQQLMALLQVDLGLPDVQPVGAVTEEKRPAVQAQARQQLDALAAPRSQEENLAALEPPPAATQKALEQPAALPPLAQADELSRSRLDLLTKELAQLRGECSRMKKESAQLRARNQTLVSFLASAESSALKLRNTLLEAGFALPSADNSPSTKRKQAASMDRAPKALQDSQLPRASKKMQAADLQELQSWASQLRSVQGEVLDN